MLGTTWKASEYSWADFSADAREIVRRLRQDAPYELIYAIPRGGLVLGVYLSHTFNLPLLTADAVAPEMLEGARTLVVDDNTITGESLAPYVAHGIACAVLLHNPESAVEPTYFARTTTDFPIFPWEADACVAATDGAKVLAE